MQADFVRGRENLTTCMILASFFFSSCAVFAPHESTRVECPTANVKQMVLVVTDNWNDSTGQLATYERIRLGDPWSRVTSPISVDVGRGGLGWGVGLHGNNIDDGPMKREGDGKSPAGVFRISEVFGFGGPDSARLFKMPYEPLTSLSQCVDDAESEYYNLIVDSLDVENAHWNSNEEMRSRDSLYRWGAFVDHNVSPRIPGRGSCIFLHVWDGPSRPTAGCTAMDASQLLEILRWLDPSKNPVLVQIPRGEYIRLWRTWDLPPPQEFAGIMQ